MGNLFLLTTIVDRKVAKKYLELYKEHGIHVLFLSLGSGTAASDILDYLGLEAAQKAVAFCLLEEELWSRVKKELWQKLKIDAPGGGIAFIVPLSSVGGKRSLQFLIENQEYKRSEEESTLKDTLHELIVVIADQGNIDLVMDAAREAGAYGGTVIHAKGTGMEKAEQFMGVSLAAEKEIIFIVAKAEQKNDIMKAVMEKAGLSSRAKSIVFSLPVTDTAGLRFIED